MRAICLASVAILMSGCFPATITVTPGVTGRVVDVMGHGVPHAVVEVWNRPKMIGPPPFSITADNEGRIARAEVDQWFLYIIPMDTFGMTVLIQARAGDARSAMREIRFGPAMRPFGFGGRVNLDLGELQVVEPAHSSTQAQ